MLIVVIKIIIIILKIKTVQPFCRCYILTQYLCVCHRRVRRGTLMEPEAEAVCHLPVLVLAVVQCVLYSIM